MDAMIIISNILRQFYTITYIVLRHPLCLCTSLSPKKGKYCIGQKSRGRRGTPNKYNCPNLEQGSGAKHMSLGPILPQPSLVQFSSMQFKLGRYYNRKTPPHHTTTLCVITFIVEQNSVELCRVKSCVECRVVQSVELCRVQSHVECRVEQFYPF